MTWQDEQRRLDAELSAGQLSADDYQRRRYELLYRYGGDEVGSADDEPEPDRNASPFPPAFRWETAPPDDSDQTTQLFTPVGEDITQVVSPPVADAERTQVVSGVPQRWGASDWASSAPPSAQQPGPGPVTRGPEAFDLEQSSGTPRVAIMISVAVVILLVISGFGLYWLWPDSTSQVAAPPPAQQQPAAPAQPPAADVDVEPAPRPGSDLPDPAEIGGDGQPRVISTLGELRAAQVLEPEEFAVLAEAGVTSSKLLVTSFEDGPRATVLITELSSPDTAATVRDELAERQRQAGFKSAPTPDPGLRSFYLVDDPDLEPTVRGFYRSGDLLLRLEVVGPEPVTTARRYDTIVQQQLATLPADA